MAQRNQDDPASKNNRFHTMGAQHRVLEATGSLLTAVGDASTALTSFMIHATLSPAVGLMRQKGKATWKNSNSCLSLFLFYSDFLLIIQHPLVFDSVK